MKIEIDLKEVLTNEFGDNESLAEIIKEQIVSILSKNLSKGIQDKITFEVNKLIDEEIKKVVSERLPSMFVELIDKEYTQIDKYGQKGVTTTLRNSLINTLTKEMVYSHKNYDSDKNYFTKNVDNIMQAKMEEFKKQYNKTVDDIFTKEALDYAYNKLRAILNK